MWKNKAAIKIDSLRERLCLQRSAFSVQRSAFSVQRSAVSVCVKVFRRSVLLFCALALASKNAQAGQWKASFTVKKDFSLKTAMNSRSDTQTINTSYASIPTAGLVWMTPWGGGASSNSSVDASSQARVKVDLQWFPGSGLNSQTDPAPATVTVKVVSRVESFVGWSSISGAFNSIGSDNGFGDASNVAVPGITVPPPQPTGVPAQSHYTVGVHLMTLPTIGGQATIPEHTLRGAFSAYSGSGNVSTFYTVYLDNRSVKIDSNSFFDSAGKNWRKEGDQRLVNWRKSDGAQVVDSVADYEVGAGWWRGGAVFTANKIGFINPTPVYKWKVGGEQLATSSAWQLDRPTLDVSGGIDRLIVANTPKITDTGISGSAQTLDATSNVSLDVTDTAPGDGAVGSNSFTVRWHLPVENWELDDTTAPVYTSTPGITPNSGLVQEWTTRSTNVIGESIPVWVEPSPWQMRTLLSKGQQLAVSGAIAVGTGVVKYYYAAATTVAAKFSLNSFAILTGAQAAIGLGEARLDSCVNSPAQFATSVSSTKDSLRNVPNADARVFPTSWANDPNILSMQAQFKMTPYVKRTSKTFVFKGDEYEMSGYQGRATAYLDSTPQVEIIGEYQFIGQGTNE